MGPGERQTPARGQGVENILGPGRGGQRKPFTTSPITIETSSPAEKAGYH